MVYHEIVELKKEAKCLLRIIKELELKETGEKVDYSGVISEITWNRYMLENRLNTLKMREKL